MANRYTKDFQISLIVNLFNSEDLMKYALNILRLNDFDFPVCKFIYNILLNYYTEYKKVPPMHTLLLEVGRHCTVAGASDIALLPSEYDTLAVVIERMVAAKEMDPDYFKGTLVDYVKHIRGSQALAQHAMTAGSVAPLIETFAEIGKLDFSKNDPPILDASVNLGHMLKPEDLCKIGFGLSDLEGITAGGLRAGGLGMITARSGVGKTNTLLNFARGAVGQGYRALFITLELSPARIINRYNAMLGCIRAGLFEIPVYEWPERDLELYHLITNPAYKHAGKLNVVDMSTSSTFTVEAIEAKVKEWRDFVEKKYGWEEAKKCKAVYVDWLERIQPSPAHARMKSYEYVPKILEELGNIGKNFDMAVWTASQATSEADGVELLQQKHMAYASHKVDPLDISIGVAPENAPDFEEDIDPADAVSFNASTNKWTLRDCNRTLVFNVNKNRDSTVGYVKLFMGPPLRLFNNRQEWLNIKNQLAKGNFGILGV